MKSAIARHGFEPKVSRDRTSCCWPINYFYPALAPHKRRWIRCVSASCLISSKLYQPVLGICLGCNCWGGAVKSNGVDLLGIIDEDAENDRLWSAAPHMGWNRVYPQAGNRLFQGIEDGAYFYFVHSYAMPVNPWTIAQCNYGEPFTAAVQKDNFYGVQFHPERSGAAGAKLLKNFLEM
ncbi:MAG: imidazole glycerol phosphate synthase subunit HisH [Escherichia sp.]